MKRRTKLILILSCVAVVLCGATALGLTLAHRYNVPTDTTAKTLTQQNAGLTESSGSVTATDSPTQTGPSSTGASAPGTANNTASPSKSGGSSGSASSSSPSGTSSNSGTNGSGSGSGSSSGSTSTSPPKPGSTTPTAPTPKPATVKILVSCRTVLSNLDQLKPSKKSIIPSSGVILGSRSLTLQSGDSVFSVLQRACRAAGISLDYSQMYGSAYVRGIGNLEEFDCGPRSGWVYSVNGTYSSVGCSNYILKAGDVIAFRYTCNGGADVGASGAR